MLIGLGALWMHVCYNPPTMNPRYYIDTMGCQMNERDSETIAGVLEHLGYAATTDLQEADVVVLNTCAVREKPQHKVFSKLGEVRKLKTKRPELVIVVAGCVAQVSSQEIRDRAPYVDVIVGPRNLSSLADAISHHRANTRLMTNCEEVPPEGLPAHRADSVNAFVNVTYGCNNFCAYCIVPYARGREESRSPEAVVQEAANAVANGHPELTLLGQNVNSYAGVDAAQEAVDFADLLARVDAIEGLKRLRFTTSHPKDTSIRLLDTMRDLDTVCEHLHLPIQAGSDEVLTLMGRGYTVDEYLQIVQAARKRMPHIALTTDVMVGFPGETQEQFEDTLSVFEQVRYDQAFMFIYSDRPGTRAAGYADKIPRDLQLQRLRRLVTLQNTISREKNEYLVGECLQVLVEGPDRKCPDRLRGRTRTNKLVIFDVPQAAGPTCRASALRGRIVSVLAEEAFLWGFTGQLAQQ